MELMDIIDGVEVYANDDSEEYEFRINGAVCSRQAYDGIKDVYDLPHLLRERTQCALWNYGTKLGPIYC